jgi:hypothetical protein
VVVGWRWVPEVVGEVVVFGDGAKHAAHGANDHQILDEQEREDV